MIVTLRALHLHPQKHLRGLGSQLDSFVLHLHLSQCVVDRPVFLEVTFARHDVDHDLIPRPVLRECFAKELFHPASTDSPRCSSSNAVIRPDGREVADVVLAIQQFAD